jgi:hypothetical protein
MRSVADPSLTMCSPLRREFLACLARGGLLLTPLAAGMAACNKGNWQPGMAEIRWGRSTCQRCNMVISDRRFAAELSGGPDLTVFMFDDIGCLLFWLRDKANQYPWMSDAATRLWVADSESRDEMLWLDPRQAQYVAKTSPMAYNFGAVGRARPGSVDFNEMRRLMLAKGR